MCDCYKIGGPWIDVDPECSEHGYEAQRRREEAETRGGLGRIISYNHWLYSYYYLLLGWVVCYNICIGIEQHSLSCFMV